MLYIALNPLGSDARPSTGPQRNTIQSPIISGTDVLYLLPIHRAAACSCLHPYLGNSDIAVMHRRKAPLFHFEHEAGEREGIPRCYCTPPVVSVPLLSPACLARPARTTCSWSPVGIFAPTIQRVPMSRGASILARLRRATSRSMEYALSTPRNLPHRPSVALLGG